MKKKLLITGLFTTLTGLAYGQARPTPGPVPTVSDSVKKVAGAAGLQGNATPKSQPKPYKTIITDKAITRAGFFKVHKVDDKYFFELADSVMGREILVVNRISKAGAEVRAAAGYAGDQIGSSVIRFEKGPNNRVFFAQNIV